MNQLSPVLGASDTRFNHSRPNNPDTSIFPYSRLANLTADAGQIIPVDCFRCYPGDRITMGLAFSLDTLPLVQAPLTRYKVVFHAYYMKARDCWKGAKTSVTKGRTGNVEKPVPRIDLKLPCGTTSYKVNPNGTAYTFDVLPLGKHSLSAFLGIPSDISGIYTDVTGNNNLVLTEGYKPYTYVPNDNSMPSATKTAYNNAIDEGFNLYRYPNALPFVMYQSICRNNYCTPNLLQESEALFPEAGDDDWLLPYNATVTNFLTEEDNTNASTFVYNYDGVYTKDDTAVRLDLLRYSLFDDDYFTTGLPWLQRGDVTTLDVNFSDVSGTVSGIIDNTIAELSDISVKQNNNTVPTFYRSYNEGIGPSTTVSSTTLTPASSSSSNSQALKILGSDLRNNLLNKIASTFSGSISSFTGKSDLTANKLRRLLALSVLQERNAHVDGSYNAMIYQHWRVNPHSEEHLPFYLGGTASYVSFNTILQTSESTASSPLGSTAGMASLSGAGQICNSVSVDDYGYCMVIMQIKPDTFYQQGVEYFLSRENTFEDYIFPEFQNLGPQPILNKEIYIADNDTDNENLFAYQEPFTFAKVRYNVNRGFFQVKPDKDRFFGSFTQARWFNSVPKLSYQFLCMCPDNMRRDWLAYPAYPAFRMQIASNVKLVRKLAYISQPETFGF